MEKASTMTQTPRDNAAKTSSRDFWKQGRVMQCAPPTFVQSSAQFDPNYVLRPRIGKDWFGSCKEATSIKENELSVTSGGLHAEQHFEYHRHIGPGDILTAEVKPGKTWEKEGKRSGKLVFNETITEYRDQHGELAITARGVGVRPERPVDQ